MTRKINFKRLLFAIFLLAIASALAVLLAKQMEYRKYKITYESLITKYSRQYELDPYLIASIIHVESANRSAVVSSKGAVGLMQLMPSTAEWICGKLAMEYSEELLTDPEKNIKLGCWYLRFIKDRIPLDDCAIAAYNAGHSIVAQWLKDERYSADGKTLYKIPYPQTEQYVVKVKRAYEKYKELYENNFKD